LEAYKSQHPEPAQGLVLATAHPAKFAEVVMKAIGTALLCLIGLQLT